MSGDKLQKKLFVVFVWLSATAYEILILKAVYVWLVSDIGKPQNLGEVQM